MASYKIRVKQSVAKDLRRIPNDDVERILQRITELSDNPRPPGCEKLSTQERYRLRQGNYRIVYEINDAEILIIVVKVGHRGDVYKRR